MLTVSLLNCWHYNGENPANFGNACALNTLHCHPLSLNRLHGMHLCRMLVKCHCHLIVHCL